MKKILMVMLLFLIGAVPLRSQGSFKKVGTAGYVFLGIPVSARTASLGEAVVAMEGLGADALFTNPGSVGFEHGTHLVSFSYSPWIADTRHEAAAYVYNASSAGVFGVSVDRLDMGEMTLTQNAVGTKIGMYNILGTFKADGIAIGLTYGRELTDRFSFGVTAKYVQERIWEYSSTNLVFDAGLLYYTGFQSLRIGGVVKNFGVDGKYLQGTFKMPTDFRFGAAMDIIGAEGGSSKLTLAVEALHPTDNDERINVGAEFWYQNMVALRGGYKFNYDEETWSAGLGIRWSGLGGPLGLDAAYSNLGRLGGHVRVTLGASF